MPRFISKTGYYKFYAKKGNKCRIKVQGEINGNVIIKYRTEKDIGWLYLTPHQKFYSQIEAVNYILKNLDSNNSVFKIIAIQKAHQELKTSKGEHNDTY